jgi:UDP-glucuronate decarboxylase
VRDLVEGMLKFMQSEPEFTGPLNLGNPKETSIKELAQKVIELTGSASEIIEKPLPVNDPKRRRPDISLARDKFGWEPVCALEDGLKETISYFEDLLKRRKNAVGVQE